MLDSDVSVNTVLFQCCLTYMLVDSNLRPLRIAHALWHIDLTSILA